MKKPVNTTLAIIILLLGLSMGIVISQVEYDLWADYSDDGYIGIDDIVAVAEKFGGEASPGQIRGKANLSYDSGWLDISNHTGQTYQLTHNLNLNSSDALVDVHAKSFGWNRTYGGNSDDEAVSIVKTIDGYAIAGTYNYAGPGTRDFWLIKIDWYGNVLWNRTYGGANDERGWSMIQTTDGGYAMAGYTESFGNSTPGQRDFWLVKTNSTGHKEWDKTYGDLNDNSAFSIVQTADEGYALAGHTTPIAFQQDFYLVKTDENGTMQWSKTYGGNQHEQLYSMIKTNDGGYLLAGETRSWGAGQDDFWLVKTNSTGHALWNKTFGGTLEDDAKSVFQTNDGGYIIAGNTKSYAVGNSDFWVIKTDITGNASWNATFGGLNYDSAEGIIQTLDGGYAVVGITESYGAGSRDYWLIKLEPNGNSQWNTTYGGAGSDSPGAIIQMMDSGYAIVGWSNSFGAGGDDIWVVITEAEFGFAWIEYNANMIVLYRGTTAPYWNFIRVRIWNIKYTYSP